MSRGSGGIFPTLWVEFCLVNLKSSHTIGIYDDVVLTFVTETSTTAIDQEHNFC